MKLISMTDFVLEQKDKFENKTPITIQETRLFYPRIFGYAEFLKQSLKLEMFVPCYFRDGIAIPYTNETIISSIELFNEYEQAKEKVLFEGFTFKEETKDTYFLLEEGIYTHALTKFRPRTIESLIGMDNLTLTPNAIKQLGL